MISAQTTLVANVFFGVTLLLASPSVLTGQSQRCSDQDLLAVLQPADKSLLTLFAAAPAQNNEQNRPPIVDVHVHAYEKDERWAIKVPNPRTGQPMTATSEQAHMQATFAEMKKYNIVKAFVSNHYAAALRWQAAAPDVILPSYAIDDPATVGLAFLRKEHAAGRLKGLGELGLQYEGIAPNDLKMEPIWALAEELDIPVGLHTGLAPVRTPYTCCPKFRNSLGNPALLEEGSIS